MRVKSNRCIINPSYKITMSSIMSLFIAAFLFICVFFPGDVYNLKLMFFFAACFFGVTAFLNTNMYNDYYILLMGVIYPIILMVWSIVLTGDVASAISGAYPATLIILVLIIQKYNINYEKYLMLLLGMLAVFTVVIVLLDIVNIFDVNANTFLRNAVYKYDMGVMGKSQAYAAYYKVFFKASPLLNIALPYFFLKKKYVMFVITFVALFFSGTRANILVAATLFVFGVLFWLFKNKQNFKIRVVIGSLLGVSAILVIPSLVNWFVSMMSSSGSVSSDAVRSGQLSSFISHFSQPSNLFFGNGFGSAFYDSGRNIYAYESEISYLDLLRKIGLFLFIPFMVFVIRPLMWKINGYYKVAYIGYLAICFTNPLLFSSTAYVLYIYVYSKYKKADADISTFLNDGSSELLE